MTMDGIPGHGAFGPLHTYLLPQLLFTGSAKLMGKRKLIFFGKHASGNFLSCGTVSLFPYEKLILQRYGLIALVSKPDLHVPEKHSKLTRICNPHIRRGLRSYWCKSQTVTQNCHFRDTGNEIQHFFSRFYIQHHAGGCRKNFNSCPKIALTSEITFQCPKAKQRTQ